MRGGGYLIVVVGLLGCGRESERATGADPADVARCEAVVSTVIASVQHEPPLRERVPDLPAAACAELYRGRGCAASWRTLFGGDASPGAAIAGAVMTCRGDYCDRLRPRPRACDDGDGDAGHLARLDAAILAFEGVEPERAERLGRRLAPFMSSLERFGATQSELADLDLRAPRVVTTTPVPPAAPPKRAGSLELVVDATGGVLYNSRPMEPLALDQLLAHLPDDTHVILRIDKDTQYAKIVALMDKIRAAGITGIAFSTEP